MRVAMLVVFIVANGAYAQVAPPTHTITLDDYFTLSALTQVAVSPDGKQIAFTEARWDSSDDQRKSDVWIIGIEGGSNARRLTFDRANDRNLKWTADSTTIYFLGNRRREAEKKPPYDGSTQVWRMSRQGGEPVPVTRVPGGVSGYDLADGGNWLFYSIEKTHHDDDEFAKLRSKYPADYGHGLRKVSEIYKLDTRTWRREKIVDETRYVREFAVTNDGAKIAMITAFDDTVVKSEGESRVDIWEDGKVSTPPTDSYRAKAASPHAWLEDLTWNTDGSRFAFCAIFDGYPSEVVLGTRSAAGWDVALAPRSGKWELVGYGRAIGKPVLWVSTDHYLVQTERYGRVLPLLCRAGTAESEAVTTTPGILAFDRTPSSGTYIGLSGSVGISNITTFGGAEQVLYSPNPQIRTWKLPTIQHVTWKAADGSTVGGVLELPYGYKKGDKLPLVVGIHGGPTTSTKADLNYDPHNGRLYFSANGYAVLFPNYRGSTGYGDKFVTDLIGRENDVEVNDIIAGVQYLIREGIADENRVGVMGWSNGGYLTNCLITRKDLPFKLRAASSGAGIVDTVAEWGFNDEPAYPKVFKKGHPWENPESYKKSSPTYDLGNIKTPTLIHVGGNDVRCPPGHSRMLYRAMKEYLNVPTELIEYPGEPHGLTKGSHRKAKMEWDLAWFEKYLKNAK